MGNLKIATWNMQGATSNNDASTFMKAISYMKNYGINVFCIQEAGILSKSSQIIEVNRWIIGDRFGIIGNGEAQVSPLSPHNPLVIPLG